MKRKQLQEAAVDLAGGVRTRAETFNFRCAELTILQTLFSGVDGVFPGEHVRIDGKCNCLEVFSFWFTQCKRFLMSFQILQKFNLNWRVPRCTYNQVESFYVLSTILHLEILVILTGDLMNMKKFNIVV